MDMSVYDSLTNDQIRRRLVDDFGQSCGPIVPSTRKLFVKKLARLENGQAFDVSNVSMNKLNVSAVSKRKSTADKVDKEKIINRKSLPAQPIALSPKQKPVERSVSPKKKSINETSAKKILAAETPIRKDKSSKKTSNESIVLNETKFVNYSDDDEYENGEGNYAANSSPLESTALSESSPAPRFRISDTLGKFSPKNIFSTPKLSSPKKSLNTSFTPLTRPALPRNSVLNYSDSESDSDDVQTNERMTKLLLNHRPVIARQPSKPSLPYRVFNWLFRSSKSTDKREKMDASERDNFTQSSNNISRLLLRFVIFFFVFIGTLYFSLRLLPGLARSGKQIVVRNLYSLAAMAATFLAMCVSYLYFRRSAAKASERQCEIDRLVDECLELLQSPDEPLSIPVLHIRDTLIPAGDRLSKKYREIWGKVVEHMEKFESRVKVEICRRDGEDFKAWKWIGGGALGSDSKFDASGASSLADENDLESQNSTEQIGGLRWQGTAFSQDTGKKSLSISASSATAKTAKERKVIPALTRFMKVRNCYDKSRKFADPDYQKLIRNSIIEKVVNETGAHDIVHIGLEEDEKESLLYIKCQTLNGATGVFTALHGWWCENRLISVRYLKEERYYQRFSEARSADKPLSIQ